MGGGVKGEWWQHIFSVLDFKVLLKDIEHVL